MSKPDNTYAFYSHLAALGVLLLFFVPVSLTRVLDGDEGFYTLASRLVMQGGKHPYSDFFFPQMPLLPYVYGAWMSIFGYTVETARGLSAIFTVATGFLLYKYCLHYGIWAGWLALFLFTGGIFVFPWFVLVKTYALSTLLLFSAFFILTYPRGKTGLRFLVTGLLLGLAVSTRLFFVSLIPVFALYILFSPAVPAATWRKRAQLSGLCLAGLLLGLAPAVFFFLAAPEHFLYNNLIYHLQRSQAPAEEALNHKYHLLKVVLGIKNSHRDSGFHLPLLLWLNLAYLSWRTARGKTPSLAFFLAVALLGLNLLPTPSYLQYFSTLAPFLIVPVIEWFDALYRWAAATQNKALPLAVLAVLGAACINYARLIPREVYRHCVSGKNVIGVSSVCPLTPTKLYGINRAVEGYTQPGEYVISPWPGHIAASWASPFPRLENHFGFKGGKRLKKQERDKFKLPSENYLLESILSRRAPLVLLARGRLSSQMKKTLEQGGYLKVRTICGVSLYLRDDRVS